MNNRLFNINILDHPTRQTKTVFFFTASAHADYFKSLLKDSGISFEFQLDEESGKFYIGIDNAHLKMAKRLNYLVFARYRKPFISNPVLKYTLLLFTAIFLTLAIVGYLRS